MSWLLVAGMALTVTGVEAAKADVVIGGESAEYLYSVLESRPEGVTRSQAKSLLGSPIDRLELHGGLITCQVKHGWIFETRKCWLPGTDNEDIGGRKVLSLGSDDEEWNDIYNSWAQVNREVNRTKNLKITGRSAERLFRTLMTMNEGSDKSYFTRSEQSRILKLPVEGAGIDEIYCQKTNWKITTSYKCVLNGVTTADSNAPTVVVGGNTDSAE